ncbi:MAG: family 16 glycosylhydrolase [Bacteroidales bacterium]|nr:family 16 glycosylhydrolase [Bacteroidales bacterium]
MKKFVILGLSLLSLACLITSCNGKDDSKPIFTVVFNGQEKVENDTISVEGITLITEPTEPKTDYFNFAGWYKEKECINQWNFNTDKVDAPITLYAKWVIAGTYTVSFSTKKGIAPESYTVDCGSKIQKPEPTDEDFYLFGWYKDASFMFPWDFENDRVTEDITLYARWKSKIAGYAYYGAELYSKQSFKYGRFEAKMKMSYAPGCVSSMFLYYDLSDTDRDTIWNEIDIEVLGKDSTKIQTNIINGNRKNRITSEQVYASGLGLNLDYHTYVIEWTPDYIAWYLDGVEMRRTTPANDEIGQMETLVKDESLRFNVWSDKSTEWVGKINPNKIPTAQYIDYVKVYSYNTETKKFTESWTDDFDTFDSNRWGKGNWDIGQVVLEPKNVTVEDGKLVLRITKETIYAVY